MPPGKENTVRGRKIAELNAAKARVAAFDAARAKARLAVNESSGISKKSSEELAVILPTIGAIEQTHPRADS
jgi:hypothetical protein